MYVRGRPHWPVLAVLAAAAVIRLAFMLAYWPAALFSDSWAYMSLAYERLPVAFQPYPPSGYPMIIRALTMAGGQLAAVPAVQHLMGLAIGALVYVCLRRLGTGRWLATVAVAVVVLDGYAIALEQYVASETAFTFCLMLSAYVLVTGYPSARRIALSAGLLGVAVTIRSAGLFAVPVWFAFVVWSRVGFRGLIALAAGLIAPLAAYGALQLGTDQGSPLRTADGWFLYSRVAGFANCADPDIPRAELKLCPHGSERRLAPPTYLWGNNSPPREVFTTGPSDTSVRANSELQRFAFAVIRDQPGAYLQAVGSDVVTLLTQNPATGTYPPSLAPPILTPYRRRLLRQHFSTSSSPTMRWPAPLVRDYVRRVHTQGWLLGLLALAAVAALLDGLLPRRRRRWSTRGETMLLSLGGASVVIGSVATSALDVRYLVGAMPLLVCGGTLAVNRLVGSLRSGRVRFS